LPEFPIDEDMLNGGAVLLLGMTTTLVLGFAAGVFPLIGAADPPGSNPLPDGIYKYAIIDSGRSSGTSTIRVSRSNGQIVIEEHSSPMEETESSRRSLDPATFVTRSYSVDSDGKRFVTLTLDGGTATLQQPDNSVKGTKTTTISAPSSATFIGVFDLNVASFFALPAALHAAHTPVAIANFAFDFTAVLLNAGPSATAPPDGVPANDVGIAMTDDKGTGTLWYDPASFVLDEFNLPTARIVFKRVSTER
jgi:hypothetical protein